ncbi:MAG: flagellar motor switch protein FliN [Pseudomonadota bacterium]|nr:flagellar motor switch protein FliN [Pseudomonadota bacterium]
MTGLAKTNSADALLPELADDAGHRQTGLDGIFDVPVKVSAVLGKTRIRVGELMGLGEGAIIALDRKVGEPIDLYVNDRLIARGELVMVDGALGVTMTEIVKDDEI